MEYNKFLEGKHILHKNSGFKCRNLPQILFDYQFDLVKWNLFLGKSALFTDTGTGKTIMQLCFAQKVYEKTNKNCLIVSPLGVCFQTIEEAKNKLDLNVNWLKHNDFKKGLNIINYESLHKINPADYDCVVLDESSILKSYSGTIRNNLIDMFANYSYKLCCTATPSPNDYEELGNTSEFLNILKRKEMLAMFFIHDRGSTSKWRLKKHGEEKFWKWLSSWAFIMSNPKSFGYKKDISLPRLNIKDYIIESDKKFDDGFFPVEAKTLQERRQARKETLNDKVALLSEKINQSNEIHLVWCDYNIESTLAKNSIKDSFEIKGSDKEEYKEKTMLDFAKGKIKCLITKPSIAGFGMNWQVCNNVNFLGLSDSFEKYYQAIRRCWRYGQNKEVYVNRYLSNLETSVLRNLDRKEKKHDVLVKNLQEHTKLYLKENIKNNTVIKQDYKCNQLVRLPSWIRSK